MSPPPLRRGCAITSGGGGGRLHAETAIYATLTVFAFFYKVNFAIAFAVLFAARIFANIRQWRDAPAALIRLGAYAGIGCALAAALVALTGYDILAYLHHLDIAAQGKAQPEFMAARLQYLPQMALIMGVAYFFAARLIYKESKWWQPLIWFAGLGGGVLLCAFGASATSAFLRFSQYTAAAFFAWLYRERLPKIACWVCAIPLLLLSLKLFYKTAHPIAIKALPQVAEARYHINDVPRWHSATPKHINQVDYSEFNIAASQEQQTRKRDSGAIITERIEDLENISLMWRTRIDNPAVSMMTFENWSALYGSLPPAKPRMHWKHFHINISSPDDVNLNNEVDGSNVALIAKYNETPYFYCWFLFHYPGRHEFSYAQETRQWHVFVRASALTQPVDSLSSMEDIQRQTDLRQYCTDEMNKRPNVKQKTFYPVMKRLADWWLNKGNTTPEKPF